jgi:hypothetical protein
LFALTPRGDSHPCFRARRRWAARRDSLANGKEFEVGRITVWKPGKRLALTWRQATFAPGQSTPLDVRFEVVGDQTRVTVEHRGWDEIPQDHVARHGFELMLFHRVLSPPRDQGRRPFTRQAAGRFAHRTAVKIMEFRRFALPPRL